MDGPLTGERNSLCLRQQSGQRHSECRPPSSNFCVLRRHPKAALINV
jgi:hypothetical protein